MESYEDRVHIGTDKIIEVLLENNVKATFFVLGYIKKTSINHKKFMIMDLR